MWEEQLNAAIEAGMNAFLKKPVDQDKLFQLLVEKFDE